MIRLTRETDYGIVLLTHFAIAHDGATHNARELAAATRLKPPMVGKILKKLKGAGILASSRGVNGGYALARRPREIAVSQIIAALEGPIAMTECGPGTGTCDRETFCAVRSNWQLIHQAVTVALESLTLADMAEPIRAERLLSLGRSRPLPRHMPILEMP